MKLKITGEVIRVFELELEPQSPGGYDDLRFRVEIIADKQKPGTVTARLWRREFYRLQPSFPQKGDNPTHQSSDELILVEETVSVDPGAVASNNWESTLRAVVETLESRLGLGN